MDRHGQRFKLVRSSDKVEKDKNEELTHVLGDADKDIKNFLQGAIDLDEKRDEFYKAKLEEIFDNIDKR